MKPLTMLYQGLAALGFALGLPWGKRVSHLTFRFHETLPALR